jgi:hypothetical protein
MRIFRSVIQVAAGPVFDIGQQGRARNAVAGQAVGDQALRFIAGLSFGCTRDHGHATLGQGSARHHAGGGMADNFGREAVAMIRIGLGCHPGTFG